MEFRLLGPLEVVEGDRSLPLGGHKQRSLLAVLLLHANEVVSSERLIDDLWGEAPPATVAKSIQVYVSGLRKQLGEGRLVTRTPGYVLRVDPSELDAARFERLVAEARSARPERAAEKLREALALWRAPPLADLAYEPFAQQEIARLEELHLGAVEQRIDADLATGRHADLVAELEVLIGRHPQREHLRGQLMLALYRSGRQGEALETYREARTALVEELGIEPSRRVRELHQAILVQDSSLDLDPRVDREPEARRAGVDRARAPGRPTPAESGRPRSGAGGVFVGRECELAELVGALEDAMAGRGRLVLVVGEPGIGKSRLTDELIGHARERGVWVLLGRCWEAGGAPAYWPWVQSLRAYVRESGTAALRSQLGAGAADLAQIVPELRQRFPDLPEPASPESEGARFRLFDATAEFLRRASESRPIVFALDDLHAADAPSLLLLRFLARELGSARILLLGAYRDVDPVPRQPLTEMLAEVSREPVTRRLSLGGLSEREVAEYVELTASEIASAQLVTALHEQSDGNPLFVGEIVRLLSVEGVHAEHGADVGLAIPQSVHDVIARRLTHLPEECKRVLLLASVLGREFALAPLARMSGVPEDELLDVLDEAMAARVVSDVPGGPGHVRFAHVLIRDTLYEALTTARRVRLHRLAVEAFERLHGDEPGPYLAELAHHSIAGRDFDKGLSYARRAGDRALALVAYEEAARLYETALEALELKPADEATRCELLLALGDAQARGGDLASAKETFAQAADLTRTLNAPEQLARAALGYGGRFVWFRAGNDRRLVPLLEDALERLPGDNPLRVRLLARLAGALRDRPVPQRRASLSREAVEIARRLSDRATLAHALEGTYAALSWPRDTETWLAMARELTELADEAGDKEEACSGHLHAWGALMVRGDVGAADEELALTAALAHELRQPAQLASLSVAQGMRACFVGRFDEAERFISRTLQFGAGGYAAWGEVNDTTFNYVTHFQSWGLRRERGGLAEVREPIERFVAEYPTFFIFRCLLANLHSQLGHDAEARADLDRLSAEHFGALEVGTEWFFASCLLAEVCASLDAAQPAADLYTALLPYAECNVIAHPEFCLGSASRYLGLLASTTSRWDDAAGHFELALHMNARMGARPWVAHTQHDYARMLLDRDEPGDSARGAELIGEALATYRELGMQSWAEKACELEQTLRGAPAP
jgi:DNA-binding SARP family transcriptional activator